MKCQPAYLSRVLNGDADLSLEQAEAATRFFALNSVEAQFFLAMLGEERAGTAELKKFWRQQRLAALADRKELRSRLERTAELSENYKAEYFSKWQYAAVHAAVSIPQLQTVDELMEYLKLEEAVIRATLEFLCEAGLIDHKDGRYGVGTSHLHLDKSSPYVGRHHLNWKVKAMEAINQPRPADMHYTSIISLSRSDMEKVREALFKAISSIRTTVKNSPEEALACYSLDFFELGR